MTTIPFYLYIAGASAEVERAAYWIKRCKDIGIHITFDWTAEVLARKTLGIHDKDLSHDERQKYATLDRRAINKADCMWLLVPPKAVHSTGCWWELAWAQSMSLDFGVVASGKHEDIQKCIFLEFTDRIFNEDEVAFNSISGLCKELYGSRF